MTKLMDYDNANPNPKKSPKQQKKSFNNRTGQGVTASWLELPTDLLLGIILRLENLGGALMLARSRDGGILIMRIYHDDYAPEPIYIRPQSQEGFDTLVAIYDDLGARQGLPSWS